MSKVLIIDSVSKKFRLQPNRPFTFQESFIRRLTGRHDPGTVIWALRDVTFSVEQGHALGIIGHNGAGKSTLLQLICGIGRPTLGKIQRLSNIGSLLELGSGFHPDMTGRENLMTGGMLSGLTKQQVKTSEQDIIAFAELENFIDQPIRTYSSGMYMRLAFATAIHFDPDVMIIDEVLAVGDSRFQQKCLEKLKSFRASDKTFVIVSHDIDQIRYLCDEVLVLEEGKVMMQGDPENAIQCYDDLMRQRSERRTAQLNNGGSQTNLSFEQESRLGTQEATISDIHPYDAQGEKTNRIISGDSLTIVLEYHLTKPMQDFALTLGIYSEINVKCFETFIPSITAAFGTPGEHGSIQCTLPELPLFPGTYYINAGLYPPDLDYIYDYHWQIHNLQVIKENEPAFEVSGVVSLCPHWSSQR